MTTTNVKTIQYPDWTKRPHDNPLVGRAELERLRDTLHDLMSEAGIDVDRDCLVAQSSLYKRTHPAKLVWAAMNDLMGLLTQLLGEPAGGVAADGPDHVPQFACQPITEWLLDDDILSKVRNDRLTFYFNAYDHLITMLVYLLAHNVKPPFIHWTWMPCLTRECTEMLYNDELVDEPQHHFRRYEERMIEDGEGPLAWEAREQRCGYAEVLIHVLKVGEVPPNLMFGEITRLGGKWITSRFIGWVSIIHLQRPGPTLLRWLHDLFNCISCYNWHDPTFECLKAALSNKGLVKLLYDESQRFCRAANETEWYHENNELLGNGSFSTKGMEKIFGTGRITKMKEPLQSASYLKGPLDMNSCFTYDVYAAIYEADKTYNVFDPGHMNQWKMELLFMKGNRFYEAGWDCGCVCGAFKWLFFHHWWCDEVKMFIKDIETCYETCPDGTVDECSPLPERYHDSQRHDYWQTVTKLNVHNDYAALGAFLARFGYRFKFPFKGRGKCLWMRVRAYSVWNKALKTLRITGRPSSP